MSKAYCLDPAQVATPAVLFAGLNNPAHVESELKRHKRRVPNGTLLLLEGDALPSTYIMLTGWLAVSKTNMNGDRQIIDFVLPGDIVDPPPSTREPSPVQIEAITDAEIAAVPAAAWAALTKDEPRLRTAFSVSMVSIIARLSERLLRLGKCSAEARVSYALLELCVRLKAIGQVHDCQFHVPLTQQQLGDFAGLSSVHVCRTLRRLSRAGVIETSDHMDVLVRNMNALSDIAGIDPVDLELEIVPHTQSQL